MGREFKCTLSTILNVSQLDQQTSFVLGDEFFLFTDWNLHISSSHTVAHNKQHFIDLFTNKC